MRVDDKGYMDIPSRWTFRVLEEFGWNMEEMADAILDMRTEMEEKDKKIEELQALTNKENV